MRWRDRRQSSNVEDRRGASGGMRGGLGRGLPGMGGGRMRLPTGLPRGGRGGGGLGIGVIVVVLIVAWFAGINPLTLLDGGSQFGAGSGQQTGEVGVPDDEGGQFVAAVLADTEDTWNEIFTAGGKDYPEPTLVLFSGSTESACGFANAASGPFYCPGDSKVYIDLAFYRELRERFKAPGDFAEAYVIAHEIGHHVPNVLGILPEVSATRRRSGESESNQLSIRLELQADCLAGVWAHSAEARGLLEIGDIDEALNAASQIGDDAIQRRTQGYVVPESFNHGTSEQRTRWFRLGYEQGDVESCDTFGVDNV
jgi:predicted metalloprotease